MIEKTSLSALLKRYCLASGLSQEALVAHVGLSVYAISNLERGIHRTPHAETFNLLSNALSLSSDQRALLLVTARFELDAPIEAPPAFPSPGLPFPSTALIGREQESPVKAISRNTAGEFEVLVDSSLQDIRAAAVFTLTATSRFGGFREKTKA